VSATSGYIERGRDRIYFEATGHGAPVVLIHGFSLDLRMWEPQVGALARSHRVIRYDVRGFGRSVPVLTPHASAAEDLLALFDHLEIPQAHVVGMSMGGRIAIDLALTCADRVATVVTIGAVLSGFPHSDAWNAKWPPMIQAAQRGDLATAKRLWLADRLLTPAPDRAEVAEVVRRIVEECLCQQFANADLLPGESVPPAAARLGELRVPLLVLVGAFDDPDIRRIAETLAAEVPGARKVVIDDGSHLVNLERPERINRLLLEFLDENR